MSGIRLPFPACVIAAKGQIERHDVLILRKHSFAQGVRSYADARFMLALCEACPTRCEEWDRYAIETLASFVMDASHPEGQLDEAKAAWLIQHVAADGTVREAFHLELLLHCLELAERRLDLLSVTALNQLRLSFCVPPSGAYHLMRPSPEAISAFDLSYVWRILKGAVVGGRLVLSSLEAAVLEALRELVHDAPNHAGWDELMDELDRTDDDIQPLRRRPWLLAEFVEADGDERVA